MRRLAWKQDLVAAVNMRVGSPFGPAPGPDRWKDLTRSSHVYTPVKASGIYDHAKEVHVWFGLKNPKGGPLFGPGYMVLTKFTTTDGWDVIVNRGFVPQGIKDPSNRQRTLVKGQVDIEGLMRFDEPKNWLSPLPDKVKNVWIVREVAEMANYLGLDPARTAPYWIDLTRNQGINGLPQGGETRISFTNNHLQYALTWYGLAVVLVCVAGVWMGRQLRGPEKAPAKSEQGKVVAKSDAPSDQHIE